MQTSSVSAPKKKAIFVFKSWSNIHAVKFAFGCLFSYHTSLKTYEMTTIFSKLLEEACPRTLLQASGSSAPLVRLLPTYLESSTSCIYISNFSGVAFPQTLVTTCPPPTSRKFLATALFAYCSTNTVVSEIHCRLER